MFYLAHSNRLQERDQGLWIRSVDSDESFDYSDGDEEELYVREALQSVSDLSSLSTELADKVVNWPSEYHFGPKRANILRSFNLSGMCNALEIGSGCGAITRYLGEIGLQVESIEGSPRRAEIARLRCMNLDNVQILNANINDIEIPHKTYDVILFIGVLEYAKRFRTTAQSDKDAVLQILRIAKAALSETGVIVIAIENKLGFKYLNGASEDHFAIPHIGIYDYPDYGDPIHLNRSGIRTYSRREWLRLLEDGKLQSAFAYPFPDYKLPDVVISDRHLREDPYAYCHLMRSRSRDYNLAWTPMLPEYQFWQAAGSGGFLEDVANSFAIVASTNVNRIDEVLNYDFVHFSSALRQPQFQTKTFKLTEQDWVMKQRLRESKTQSDGESSLGFTLNLNNEKYVSAETLQDQWIKSLRTFKNPVSFENLLEGYFKFLQELFERDPFPESLIDAVPGNIKVVENERYTVFDREWVARDIPPAELVYFRALMYFAHQNGGCLRDYFELYRLSDIRSFVNRSFKLVGMALEDFGAEFSEREDAFQVDVMAPGVPLKTDQVLQRALHFVGDQKPTTIYPTLYWSSDNPESDGLQSIERSVKATNQWIKIQFEFPTGTIPPSQLRFDPVDHRLCGAYCWLEIAKLEACVTNSNKAAWSITGMPAIERKTEYFGLVPGYLRGARVFFVNDQDPQLHISLPEPLNEISPEQHYTLQVDMLCHISCDDTIGLDTLRSLLASQEATAKELQSRTDELIAQQRQNAQILQAQQRQLSEHKCQLRELDLIKASRWWRIRNFLKRTAVDSTLGRFDAGRTLVFLIENLGRKTGMTVFWEALKENRLWMLHQSIDHNQGHDLLRPVTDYEKWHNKHLTQKAIQDIKQQLATCHRLPLISIVMPTYNTHPRVLQLAINSIGNQIYQHWELCIADDCSSHIETKNILTRSKDPRIKTVFLPENRNISSTTNAALELATGEYVAFMDHDDELSVDALAQIILSINDTCADMLYSDEDFITLCGRHADPHFKPEYSPDLLLCHNYITHLVVLKNTLLNDIGWLSSIYDGAQDYDLILRAAEAAQTIHHIPKVLYHRRRALNSTSFDDQSKPEADENGRKAVAAALRRRGIKADVAAGHRRFFYHVQYSLPTPLPLISIIIPFETFSTELQSCVATILDQSSYERFEIVLVSNSTDPGSHSSLQHDPRVRYCQSDQQLSVFELVNFAVARVQGEHLILLDPNIRIITPEWIQALLVFSHRIDVGAVGAKLYYPDDTIKHAGIALGPKQKHVVDFHHRQPRNSWGYFDRLMITQNVTAVSAACLMVKRSAFDSIDGFNVEDFIEAYCDVDFCLRLRERGLLNILTRYAEAYHANPADQYECVQEENPRLQQDKVNFEQRHREALEHGDPYYSPHLFSFLQIT